MTRADARAAILAALSEIAPEADYDDLDPEDSLREQLDIDSMDLLRLAQLLHEQVGVEIPALDYPKLDTLDGAAAYIAARAG